MDDQTYYKIVKIINSNRSGNSFSLDEVIRIAYETYTLGSGNILNKLDNIIEES